MLTLHGVGHMISTTYSTVHTVQPISHVVSTAMHVVITYKIYKYSRESSKIGSVIHVSIERNNDRLRVDLYKKPVVFLKSI